MRCDVPVFILGALSIFKGEKQPCRDLRMPSKAPRVDTGIFYRLNQVYDFPPPWPRAAGFYLPRCTAHSLLRINA